MDVRLVDLPWLVQPPADFRKRVRELDLEDGESAHRLVRLSQCALNVNQLQILGRKLLELARHRTDAVRVGILSNGTVDLLVPALQVAALRHGVWLDIVHTDFDQVAAQALNPNSRIHRAQCLFVLLIVDHRGLPLTPSLGAAVRAEESVQDALAYVDSIRAALHRHSSCTVIVQTAPQIGSGLLGNFDRSLPGTQQWSIDRYNAGLRAAIAGSSDLLLDAASLAELVGLAHWHDAGQWMLGKFPFSLQLIPLYSDGFGRLIAAARGRARKCLVLDLDNTLWGGVVGDDGLNGIVVGNGSPDGEAFLNVQRTALALRERGIVLAVSSKNDDRIARGPFRFHPEMLLKEHHIAVFQANWQDKASNLEAIANTLNIGLDSLVLLDDNPAERAQVRDALPMVAVPELPADPAGYAETLLAAGYFEAIGFTSEDRARADQYQANAARAQVLGEATDLSVYLRSLEMTAICGPFDALSRARVTQLINKSNQFNLTTRRYTATDIEALERSQSGLTLQLRLTDRFGDNGIVAIIICREAADTWNIDTWLMSCRVLNRRVEEACLNYVVKRAQAAGIRTLIGEYLPTDRNEIVKDHYARLGFGQQLHGGSGSVWQLDVDGYVPRTVPIEIVARPADTYELEQKLA